MNLETYLDAAEAVASATETTIARELSRNPPLSTLLCYSEQISTQKPRKGYALHYAVPPLGILELLPALGAVQVATISEL